MRKVLTENLPLDSRGYIDWKSSKGYRVPFVYDEIEEDLIIIGHNPKTQTLSVKYRGDTHYINTTSLKKCRISNIIGIRALDYIYDEGTFVDTQKSKLKILKQIRINGVRGYKYECQTCSYSDKRSEWNMRRRFNCPICGNKGGKIRIGYNDMWTTNPNLAKMLYYPSDGYKYTQSTSKHHLSWNCPNCENRVDNKTPQKVNSQGLSCPYCSDGISYPEKFLNNVLKQAGVNFKFQKMFEWSGRYRYDFYINSLNTIIETDGLQHDPKSIKTFESVGGDNKRSILSRDREKKDVALRNGVLNFIRIDCYQSNMRYIKNSILSSRLNDLLNLDDIDWELCGSTSQQSYVTKACELWNEGYRVQDISNMLDLGRETIRTYLKSGSGYGWCKYSKEASRLRGAELGNPKKCKEAFCVSTGVIYTSVLEASSITGISKSSIAAACRGEQKKAGGYKWMYKDDYDKYIESQSKIS